jgi:hypothetical protein
MEHGVAHKSEYLKAQVKSKLTFLLSTDHELIPAGCKRAGGVSSMQVDGRLYTGQR